MSNELDTQSLLIELMGPILCSTSQRATEQVTGSGSDAGTKMSWTKMEWPGEWTICGDDCFSFLADCITQYSIFFFSFFHSSLVFPLDLCVMYLYVHCDRVNTSTVTTTAYDSDYKWMETHSGRLQDCLQCDIEASLLSRSQDTSLEGLPSRITPSDIFSRPFCPP